MSFTATVENDTIKLPPGFHLPDGTRVTVEPDHVTEKTLPSTSLAERLAEFIGCIKDAPPDLAENHDHYAHGAPKGIDKL